MENKLRSMFEYQRFEQNKRLADIIDAAETGAEELSDDQLFTVSAAGEADIARKHNDDNE